jgi:hypothetical protein
MGYVWAYSFGYDLYLTRVILQYLEAYDVASPPIMYPKLTSEDVNKVELRILWDCWIVIYI